METATKVIIVMGGILATIGIGWLLTGVFDYFAGRKNGNPQMMDQGMTSIICGAAVAAISSSIAAAIVAGMQAISF